MRAKLWQYLREQADAGQLKAIEAGRAAGVPWHYFAEALCVTSKQGAYQKARRLKAEQVRGLGERRTLEVAREHADRAAAEERAERALILVQERRFPVARRIAWSLLEHRAGLVLDSWAAYWLGELADTIDDRDDPAERARFTGWLESFVRAIPGVSSYGTGNPGENDHGRLAHRMRLLLGFTESRRVLVAAGYGPARAGGVSD